MTEKISAYLKKIAGRICSLSFCAFIAFVFLTLTIAYAITPLDGEDELYNGIIRFHVLANSDSKEDQELKLKVRDAVTEYTTVLLENCTDIAQAKAIISESRDEIISAAKKTIAENGYGYDVTFETGFEAYPKRTYGKYTFPAGTYYSLRLKIGKAKGKNWWCVLFPPMCLGSVTVEKYDNSDELQKIGFSEDEINLISENKNTKKEIRFFFLDFFYKAEMR